MLQNQKVPSIGLEYLPLFGNILSSRITKVSTRPDLFPCSKVIGWILSKVDAGGVIISNVEGKGFTSFTLAFIDKSYNLPVLEVSMTNDWINSLTIDYVGCAIMMMTEGKSFRQRASREYETSSLRTP